MGKQEFSQSRLSRQKQKIDGSRRCVQYVGKVFSLRWNIQFASLILRNFKAAVTQHPRWLGCSMRHMETLIPP